jgi:hypothetical protein
VTEMIPPHLANTDVNRFIDSLRCGVVGNMGQEQITRMLYEPKHGSQMIDTTLILRIKLKSAIRF